jgi:integrase
MDAASGIRDSSIASPKARRSNGTGTLHVQTRADGRQLWYGRWYVGTRRLNRRIGLKRPRGSGKGLTKIQAEEELRRMMLRDRPLEVGEAFTFAAAAELMLRELDEIGRKPATLANYRSILGFRLLPRFGEIPVDRIRRSQVEALATQMIREGASAHTRANTLKLLSQVFNYSLRQRGCRENPCLGVRRPRIRPSSDIHFLDKDELEMLVGGIDIDKRPFGAIDRAIVLTAAMTGMRQGELLALRWLDVDWEAKRIRVRRNYVRGYMGTPKSRSGERSAPLSTRVAAELTQLRHRSRFRHDDDLVFANPLTGGALDHASLLRRFKKALKAAGVRCVRFHDLRHTFGTRMAASPDVAMRQIQEWMGHRDYRTTLIYADYEPGEDESGMVDRAFA